MKPRWLILMLSLLMVTGCSISRIDYNNIDKAIDTLLSEEVNITNTYSMGYQYYLPRSVKVYNISDYNEMLYTKNNKYYLYVDIVSYYHGLDITYKEQEKSYYSKFLEYNNKQGYIEINEINNKYFIEMMYNYSKIESLVEEKDLSQAIIDICYILSNVEYNDKVIDSLIGDNSLNLDATSFNIFKPKREEGNFLDYIEEYDIYEEEDSELPGFEE